MIFGSVCSGVEAASVAWEPLGWHPAWFAEIEAFPSAVLAHRFPHIPNLGDMTKLSNHKVFNEQSIDVLVGGTPCQSFSVAGLHKGMADPRGNLALTYLALADRKRPRWIIWENVPGVLSSNQGRDFGAFLGALGQLGYGFAYRVLDAQYFGVAQRRRRVFVIGYLGDWRTAAAVLFEPHSMQGHPAPRRETGERAAPTISARTKGGGGLGTDAELDGALVPNVAWALQHRDSKGPDSDTKEGHLLPDKLGVRRLTPRECERLQGFPDDWTLVPYRGKPASDGPRYKAMGNSMAVPVMRWIGQRINSTSLSFNSK
ncbi:Dcm Site-specific DNA methylase [uncultured Caudovirales phage]|uniref:Cytosine-specific methyltransferase n=1 Tax=uncultured Caudovirales phage TaxID=2100421 RepID=A0A6J5LR54_9CAUD|nr:Dcm Site-specific DNA methylase [uncultured Caudovirales phage]